MNRECIEKILSMIPSDEEKTKILEAQINFPDTPLGTAEQFLLTLSSISELQARLNLWAFRLDYDTIESEISDPLMDLKTGVDDLRKSRTLRFILAVLLKVGNFLNSGAVKAFDLDILCRVPEIKDTVHKHSLLHHICQMVIDQFPDSTDLYSEIGALVRSSKIDWDELHNRLIKLESDCKTCMDHLRLIAKHDTNNIKVKLSEFISDCAERIMILKIIYKRILNRFNKFLLYMGYSTIYIRDMKIGHICKILAEFALEYRTTREKLVQQRLKKASQKERKKTRGKTILDTENFASTKESRKSKNIDETDNKNINLNKVLQNGCANEEEKVNAFTLPGQRIRKRQSIDLGKPSAPEFTSRERSEVNRPFPRSESTKNLSKQNSTDKGTDSESHYDTAEDDILEACVKTATTPSKKPVRDRKRARNRDRKSLRRTLKTGLNDEESAALYT